MVINITHQEITAKHFTSSTLFNLPPKLYQVRKLRLRHIDLSEITQVVSSGFKMAAQPISQSLCSQPPCHPACQLTWTRCFVKSRVLSHCEVAEGTHPLSVKNRDLLLQEMAQGILFSCFSCSYTCVVPFKITASATLDLVV